jgi:hypothetical protein
MTQVLEQVLASIFPFRVEGVVELPTQKHELDHGEIVGKARLRFADALGRREWEFWAEEAL